MAERTRAGRGLSSAVKLADTSFPPLRKPVGGEGRCRAGYGQEPFGGCDVRRAGVAERQLIPAAAVEENRAIRTGLPGRRGKDHLSAIGLKRHGIVSI